MITGYSPFKEASNKDQLKKRQKTSVIVPKDVQMSKEWQNYTLAKKFCAANPGITLGGSSFVINANPTDSISRVPLKMHSVHKGRLKF